MVRRSKPHSEPKILLEDLQNLLNDFSSELSNPELRTKVKALVPSFYKLRDLGSSLIDLDKTQGARDRIISYMRLYIGVVIDGDELMVVSGIGEWARRVRELRVQFGWSIYSGSTFKEIAIENPDEISGFELSLGVDPLTLKPDQYVLTSGLEDREAAYRWHILNNIRRKKISVKNKLIEYLIENVGRPVTGEELRYLANDKKEWARRTRELRTEDGWPVMTKQSGREDLPVGSYLLEENRQAPEHDRHIPDPVRVSVLNRDGFCCSNCGWDRSMLSREDPRNFLELHHLQHHKDRGSNTEENLTTLCNVCHDDVHRRSEN
jgi:HNH endonuclease